MVTWILIPLLVIQSGWALEVPEKSPICSLCSCTDVVVDYDVNCGGKTKQFIEILLTSAYYVNKNATIYPIKKLQFNNVVVGFFNGTFPPSDLKILDLSGNALKNISNEAFKNLQKMEELILSNNFLGRDVMHPDLFKGVREDGQDYPLKRLRTLRLDNNEIHSLDSGIFEHIDRELKSLYLNDNPLKVIDIQTTQAITSLAYLEVLDLTNCQLNTLPENFLHTNAYLYRLNLSANAITDISSLGLDMSKNLEILDLSENLVTNLTQETGFPVMKKLRILHMCRMEELVEVSKYSLGQLSALEELHLSDNHKLQKIHQDALIRADTNSETPIVQRIQKIYLRNNQLAHLDLELNWDVVTDFDIRGNPWTCECENSMFLNVLVPKYIELKHKDYAEELKCAAPIEMVGKDMYTMHEQNYQMRCLDLYGNRPERDGTLLVCMLIGLLLGIVLVLGCMYSYQKHWFGVFDNSPAAFSRQFYGRTKSTEDGEIY